MAGGGRRSPPPRDKSTGRGGREGTRNESGEGTRVGHGNKAAAQEEKSQHAGNGIVLHSTAAAVRNGSNGAELGAEAVVDMGMDCTSSLQGHGGVLDNKPAEIGSRSTAVPTAVGGNNAGNLGLNVELGNGTLSGLAMDAGRNGNSCSPNSMEVDGSSTLHRLEQQPFGSLYVAGREEQLPRFLVQDGGQFPAGRGVTLLRPARPTIAIAGKQLRGGARPLATLLKAERTQSQPTSGVQATAMKTATCCLQTEPDKGMTEPMDDLNVDGACSPACMDTSTGQEDAGHPLFAGAAATNLHTAPAECTSPAECTQCVCGNASTGQPTLFWGNDTGSHLGYAPPTAPHMGGHQNIMEGALLGTQSHAKTKTPADQSVAAQANPWRRKEFIKLGPVDRSFALTEDGATIILDEHAVDDNQMKLERALVGKLLRKRLPFFFLNTDLQRKWSQWGKFKLIMVAPDCFVCIFDTTEARDAVLMNGPWFVAGNFIGMDRWSPSFTPKSLHGLSSPIWVRLPDLPLLYWDNVNIARVASFIGEPLWVDHQTNSWGQSMYARVCIRIDLSQKLPTGVWIHERYRRFFQAVEYEGITQLCFACGRVGHKIDSCPSKKKQQQLMNYGKTTSHTPLQPRKSTPLHGAFLASETEIGECSNSKTPTNAAAQQQGTTQDAKATRTEGSVEPGTNLQQSQGGAQQLKGIGEKRATYIIELREETPKTF